MLHGNGFVLMLGPDVPEDTGTKCQGGIHHLSDGLPTAPLPVADLAHVSRLAGEVLRELDGALVLITGGSGFLGSWMAESLCFARDHLGVAVRAALLVRNPNQFSAKFPHLIRHPALDLYPGDLETLALERAEFTHVIHAAAPVVHKAPTNSPLDAFDAIVIGTRRLLEISKRCGVDRFLLLSSGAVYGRQPSGLYAIPENYSCGPDQMNPASLYGESKRAAELLCALAWGEGRVATVVARGFTFVGPRLPLNKSFAVGNFIADRIAHQPIQVTGDGTPWRSYLYAADAAVWLWTMLLKGKPGRAYNVGSDDACTIHQLAREVASLGSPVGLTVQRSAPTTAPGSSYVPCITRAAEELGLSVQVKRSDALLRTLRFYDKTA